MTSLPLAAQRRLSQLVSSPGRVIAARLAAILGRAKLPTREEFAALRPATRALMAGLAVWIGLVGLVTLIAVASVAMSTISFPTWLGARASSSRTSEVRSPASFENIAQRPLFSRSRQGVIPATVVAPSVSPVALDPGISLKGVFISGGLAKAFLLSGQNPLGTWVEANGEIEGWRIVAIKPGEVVLDGQNEKLVVPLNVSGGK
jgi:ribosome-associated protein YbcJ (S4-like RNA binding protein)